MNRIGFNSISFVALAAAGMASASAQAAEGAAAQSETAAIEEVIVTAQRRAEDLQKTPLAVTALSGATLADRQVVDVRGLSQMAPSVSVGASLGIARIAIRGISYDTLTQAGESRVAFHVDGVYVSRPPAQLASFFDVDRVEVLRGPQGTLYGRNATAGAINVITGEPKDQLSGYVRGTVGNYSLVRTEGALNIPLGEGVAGRVAFQTADRDGYGRNLATGGEIDDLQTRAARAKLRFELSPEVKLLLSGDYFEEHDNSGGYILLGAGYENASIQPVGVRFGGGAFATKPWDSAAELSGNDRKIYGFSSILEWDLGGAQLYALSGYRRSSTFLTTENDGTPTRLTVTTVREDSRQYSQELRLQGDLPFGTWLIGGYFFDEKVDGYNALALDRVVLGLPPQLSQGFFQGGSLSTRAYAAFAQADFTITDKLTLTVGGRYSSEKKEIDEQFQFDTTRPYSPSNPVVPLRAQTRSKTWSALTPKVGINYAFSPDVFGYLSFSQGFKSGGFNLGGVQPPFNQEKITAYETGVRADWMDSRLRTNVSAFYYDYKNIQVTKLLNNISSAENAAAAELYGLEAEITAVPVENLQFDIKASLMKSRFVEFISADAAQPSRGNIDLSGNRLPQAPNYTVNVGAQYTYPLDVGDLTFRVDGTWVDKVYFSAFNRASASEPAHSRFDVLMKFSSNRSWAISAFAKNITNEANVAYATVGAGFLGFPILGTYEPPRTFGVVAELKF